MPEHRSSTAAPTVVACVAGAVIAAFSAVVACSTTDDPRAGTRASTSSSGGTSGTSGSSSSSGGIDAAIPEGPIECGSAPGVAAPFTKQALLGAASECAAWHACNFVNAATSLRKSVRDQAEAPSEDKLTAARASWKTAMNEWSKMEVLQFGPVTSKIMDPYHGRGLRSFIHPWPQTNRCEVEKQIATKGWQGGIDTVLPSARGMYALEYVLYYPGTDTVCLPGSPTGQAWAGLAPADLTTAKNDYAVAVADNVLALALEVRNVWLPEGQNFKAKLTAFEGYGSEQEALNVVAWALFYIEKEVKDLKLASRAGIVTTDPTPETPFALVEIENIRTNLRAFRSLFQGCSADGTGIGFDDWLVAAGHQQLANEMLAALGQVEAAADAFPSFGQASQAQFKQLYDTLKVLTDLLKTQFFGSASPLNLKLPSTAASDTD
jgi:predicted lipoprotein